MQILFSTFKNLIILFFLAFIGRCFPLSFIYVPLIIFTISIYFLRGKWQEMSRTRIDCYFGLLFSIIALFYIEFSYIIIESKKLIQFFIFIWIITSIIRLIQDNLTKKKT